MKKVPRILLIEERKRHQWSQQKIADLIGTTRHNISRWELGMTTPGAYFRTKLCTLFEKRPQELDRLLDQEIDKHQPDPTPKMPLQALNQHFPLWYVPYSRNPFFTGRETILNHLYKALHHNHTAILSQSCTLSGLAGIGKTQTAIEYAYRYASDYAAIFWISAETSGSILSSFVAIAELLNLPEKEEREQSRMVAAVIRWFNNHDQWLLIFDNVEEIGLAQGFLPTARGGSLLFTSRRQALGISAQSLNLEKMTTEEGIRFLLHRTRLLDLAISLEQVAPADEATAWEIVVAMDGLPLALDQAGAYIETTQCGLANYQQLLQTSPLRLLADREPHAGHPLSVTRTFMLIFERIEQSNKLAAELLTACAFLAPEAIPEAFFLEGATYLGATFEALKKSDPFQFHTTIKALLAYSLLQRNIATHTLTIHRLVQAVLKEYLSEADQIRWTARVISAMSRLFPANKTQVDYWRQCEQLLPHAQQCITMGEKWKTEGPERITLMCHVVNYLANRAQFLEAEQLCQRAIELGEHALGSEHPLVAQALKALAGIFFQQGKYEETKLICQRALAIEEQVLDSEDPQLAGSLNNLGILYAEQREFEAAEPLLQRALSIWEQALGPTHPRVTTALHNLGAFYLEQGKYDKAEPFFQRTLYSEEQTLGPEDPDLAFPLVNLGQLYRERGDYPEAERFYQRALQIRVQTFGQKHHLVAEPLIGMALIRLEQGNRREAEVFFRSALQIWEQTQGLDHPLVAEPLIGMAMLHLVQREYEQAELLYRRALSSRERAWGPEHHLIAEPLQGLAQILTEQGDYEHAKPLYQRALMLRQQRLGPYHPQVAESLHHMAHFYQLQQQTAEALTLYQQALTLREQTLGANHPKTAQTRLAYMQLLHVGNKQDAMNSNKQQG